LHLHLNWHISILNQCFPFQHSWIEYYCWICSSCFSPFIQTNPKFQNQKWRKKERGE
jgi:hypothetical protein